MYVRRPQLSPFLGADAEATYKKGERERKIIIFKKFENIISWIHIEASPRYHRKLQLLPRISTQLSDIYSTANKIFAFLAGNG